MGKNKKKSKAAAAAKAAARGVVGPNYFQVLTGCIANKNISLILVGESHEDAIDITRIGGGKIKEGWISTNYIDLTGEIVGKFGGIEEDEVVRCGICKRNTKLLPLGKAKEWGNDVGREEIEYMEPGREMVLLWVPNSDGAKGRTFLMELFIHEDGDDDKKKDTNSRSHHPPEVIELLDSMTGALNQMGGVKSLSKAVHDLKADNSNASYTLFQWADLDEEARIMNHRRLLGEDIETTEYDELINKRKSKRQKEDNLWTFDDWLLEVKSKLEGDSGEDIPSLHLLLEAPIPPSEVELCRDLMPGFEHTQAADCIRCLSQDSDESSIDMHDPSCDGFGGYIPFMYRQLLKIERTEKKSFLHCVDCRDLGCQHETEDIHSKEWLDLLNSDERDKLLRSSQSDIKKHAHHKDGKCLPDWQNSPEEAEIDRLRDSGVLKSDEEIKEDDDGEEEEDELITFPSFENFLNVSEILYYTPHIKISYAPFLGKVVKSFDTWNAFFFELFFGGTISDALDMLDLSNINGQYLHTRSPIMKFWNAKTGEYEFHKRLNEENDLTLPMFPIKVCLKSRGSEPSRTWCSYIFASLLDSDCKDLNDMAKDIKEWLRVNIAAQCKDPKEADNEIGGGDWFLAYLRECHREIYEDIDRSDPEDISKRTSVQGETKKHKIGAIKIPSCVDGFRMITEELNTPKNELLKPTVSRSSEVMAKILIDIYMNNLVDAATLAKIAQLISQEAEKKNITIVCYAGSCHTKKLCDFFMQPSYKFKKRIFAGKFDWEDDERKIIHLPPELWDLKRLFS